MATFNTFNGLIVEWIQNKGLHLVTITGDSEKVLYSGDSMGKASAVYRQVVKEYEQRKKAEG